MSDSRVLYAGELLLGAVLALCCWAVLPGWGPELAGTPVLGNPCHDTSTAKSRGGSPTAVDFVDLLCTLPVRPDKGVSGYERAAFGEGWADLDGDGCDTRQEILARDLMNPLYSEDDKCRVTGGTLQEPYTGEEMSFAAPPGNALQIDHVVALADAWLSGAAAWSKDQRLRYANDPGVLLAVDGAENQEKGAGNAAAWLPPNQNYRCAYAQQQVLVKYRWHLSVTAAEQRVLWGELKSCVSNT